jgi:hypothetical protein
VALFAASLVAACSTPAAEKPAAAAASPFRPVASIREVMNSVIDPSVDEVWNSVGSTVDEKGLTDRAPTQDEHWAEVRRHALIVSEAANLLLMHNRPVAPPGAPSLAPGVELTPEEIRVLIDKKDSQALFDAGEKIDETCENCHSTFWYPKAVNSSR